MVSVKENYICKHTKKEVWSMRRELQTKLAAWTRTIWYIKICSCPWETCKMLVFIKQKTWMFDKKRFNKEYHVKESCKTSKQEMKIRGWASWNNLQLCQNLFHLKHELTSSAKWCQTSGCYHVHGHHKQQI